MSKRDKIVSDLRERIEDGEWEVGDPLPTVADLAAHYRVSHAPVIAARNRLAAEGLLSAGPGGAMFVIHAPDYEHEALAEALITVRKALEAVEVAVAVLQRAQQRRARVSRPPIRQTRQRRPKQAP